MAKVAVVYWSGTGNTQKMAEAVVEGAKGAGAEVECFEVDSFSVDQIDGFDGLALGCPSMGAEVLEEEEFEPMFASVEGALHGKKIALFGSWGWGGGAWMNDWEARCNDAGVLMQHAPVICQEAPDDAALAECRELGASLV